MMNSRPCSALALSLGLLLAGCATTSATVTPGRTTTSVAASARPLSGWTSVAAAPKTERAFPYGPEAQLYPAGAIVGVHVRRWITQDEMLLLRAAWNFTERQDFGEHDDETGDGPGMGLGYRRYMNPDGEGWVFGGQLDAWDLSISWEDAEFGGPVERGSSELLVVQPSAVVGWSWLGEGGDRFEITASLGMEINVETEGEEVGEGSILLVGFSWIGL